MRLSRNAQLAFTTYIMLSVNVVLEVARMQPSWMAKTPMFVHHSTTVIFGVIAPLIFLAGAFALAFILDNDRRGHYIAVAYGAVAVLWNIPATYWRFEAGATEGALLCIFQTLFGLLLIRQAVASINELGRVTEPRVPSNAS